MTARCHAPWAARCDACGYLEAYACPACEGPADDCDCPRASTWDCPGDGGPAVECGPIEPTMAASVASDVARVVGIAPGQRGAFVRLLVAGDPRAREMARDDAWRRLRAVSRDVTPVVDLDPEDDEEPGLCQGPGCMTCPTHDAEASRADARRASARDE